MKNLLLTIALIYFANLDAHAQDVFSSSSSTSISFGDNISSILVTGLPNLMNQNYGLEKVCILIEHEDIRDLKLILKSPTGTEIVLSDSRGSAGDSYTNTCFTGVISDPPISTGSGDFTGNFLPDEQLGLYNLGLEDPNGTWELNSNDKSFFDNGTLDQVTLTFSNTPALIPSAANDECSNAINIEMNNNYTCTNTTTGNIVDANASQNIPQCSGNSLVFDDDIWFDFTATSSAHEFTFSNIVGSSTELIYQVLEGDCQSLNEIYCGEGSNNNFTVKNLNTGSKYYLRVASKTSTSGQNITFDICIKIGVPDPPTNDECSGAILIPNSGGCVQVSGTVEGATASSQEQSCPESGSFSNDVWFYFVANQSNMFLKVTDIVGIDRNLDFQFSTGTCDNLTQRFCFFEGNPGDIVLIAANNLNIGSTYYVRVSTFTDAPKNTSFNICIDAPSPAPDNDECSGAITIVPDNSNCNFVSGILEGATGNLSGINCAVNFSDYFDDDVWFKFQASESSHTISILNIQGSTDDLIYEVLSGSCGNFSSIACQDDPNESVSLSDLSIGQTYFIRVASYLDLVQNTSFDICIGENKLLVRNTLNSGPGSLRAAVDFASAGDTIKFVSSINEQAIKIQAPAITFNQAIVLQNDFGSSIIIENQDINNTQDLLLFNEIIRIEGLRLVGNPVNAMKVRVNSGGQVQIYQE